MTFMSWNDELVLGIASIDEQHQAMVSQLNALHDALSAPAPDAKAMSQILEDLVDVAMNHFIAEEELLKRHGYAQTDAHVLGHSGETEKLVQLLDQCQADAAAVNQASLTALKDWLTRHIQVEDKAAVPLLKSKGSS